MKYKDNENKRGFTLIELIAILVIMAIIALSATPLVINIVKKAKDSANKRSVDAYGKALELAIATHLLDTGDYPTSLDNLTVEYTGNEVVCNVKTLNEDGSIYLSECSVKGVEVKYSSTEDGWYHYGRFISNEITYQSYAIGDVVTYNGMEFYVIEASDERDDRVTMLKAEPLTVDEVNTYGAGHINRYTMGSTGIAYDSNGYGGMAYYSSETCGYIDDSLIETECTTDYERSDIKYVVDGWALDKIQITDLKQDSLGYKARLLTYEDLTINLGYDKAVVGPSWVNVDLSYTPNWLINSNYRQWTMSVSYDSEVYVWSINSGGSIYQHSIYSFMSDGPSSGYGVVRPVITLKKSAI